MTTPIFVIADERCGGTSLGKIFQDLLDYKTIDDPQNPRWIKMADLHCKTNTKKDVDNMIHELYDNRKYNYIKVCFFSYEKNFNNYLYLIKKISDRGYKIIYLYRENLLKRALSKVIANKTKVWEVNDINNKNNKNNKNNIYNNNFSINIRLLGKELKRNRKRRYIIQKYLKKNNIKHLAVSYEFLYGPTIELDQRIARLTKILQYVDCPKINEQK